ncbi:MAG TPA: hypothetical protein VJ773_00970 [Gemmatimonadales bacterium]|nr:hypothetical protein [Gemmatimonadales bacterium]
MNRIRIAALLAALVLMPAAAQAQTFSACYVPKTGSVYRIKVDAAPQKCGQNHVEFTWEAGGTASAPVYFPTTHGNAFFVPPGETAELTMSCPVASDHLVLGGYIKHGPDAHLVDILADAPDGVADTWIFRAHNHGTEPSQVGTFIRCFHLLAGP